MVLSSFGEISNNLSRESDIIARFGGEEFVFFLPDTNLTEANEFAKRLCEKIQKTDVIVDNSYIEYTVSIGIATNQCTKDESLEEFLKYSDKALYMAKHNGRNQIVMY